MKKVLVLALSLAIVGTACSTEWISTLDSIVAAAAPALINILQIVAVANGRPMNGNLALKINSDATLIKTLAGDFVKASSASAPGVCRQLEAAVSAYQGDQQQVLQIAQVSDPNTQTKITLLANLVAETVQAITAIIPSCQSADLEKTRRAAPSYSVTNFAARYNEILVAPTGDPAVDGTTKKLTLHQHSRLARSITFGLLQ